MKIPPPSPDRIGPYRVIRPLAQGGMAAVYEVEEEESGQRVALKLLTQRGLARTRFLREYQALTRLDHPHILRVYRFGFDDEERPWLTMELLDGDPAQVYAKGLGRPGTPGRTTEVIRIAREIATALGYLHDRGIVHRDLKSSNVMVLPNGVARLLDFGTARLLESDDAITRHGEFVGTFAYAPPEQLTGGHVDERADIYSLGVLLYRLLTGKRPFDADNPQELAKLHLEHEPPPPSKLAAGVPPEVAALVMQMLAKEPSQRPASAWVVAERLGPGPPQGAGRPAASGPPGLVGREDAVAQLSSILDAARPGGVGLVVGESGSGRERLMQHAHQLATERKMGVFPAVFEGGSGLDALAGVGRRAGRGLALVPEAARSLTALAQASTSRDPQGLAAALASLLEAQAERRGQPVVVLLRRLHRAGPDALQAIVALRERLVERGLRALILASCSTGAAEAGGAVARRLAGADLITLEPMELAQMARLVSATLGRRPAPPGLARRVRDACGGMPGHAVEVLHAMIHEGLLVHESGVDSRLTWQDRSGGRVAIPARVRADLQLRLESLDASGRRLLDALCVASVPVPRAVASDVTELSAGELARAIESLEGGRLIDWHGGRMVVRLGLTTQLVREQLRESRRRVLRERLAAGLQQEPPSEAKIRLMLDAGMLEQAVRDAVVWGNQRLVDSEVAQALPLLVRVSSVAAERSDLPKDQLAPLMLVLGAAAAQVGPGEGRAVQALDRAAEWAAPELQARIDLERAILARRVGDLDRARQLLGRARHRLERFPDPTTESLLRCEDAEGRLRVGEVGGAATAWRRAAEQARAQGHDLRAAQCDLGQARARAALGEIAAATAQTRGAWMELRALRDDRTASTAAVALARLLRIQGRLSEATGILDPLRDAVRTWGGPMALARLLLELAACREGLHQLGEARDLLGEVDALAPARSHPEVRLRLQIARGLLALASDDLDGARESLSPAWEQAQGGGFVVLGWRLQAAVGEALAPDEPVEGLRLIENALQQLRSHRLLPAQAEAAARLVRAQGPTVDPAPAWAGLDAWLQDEDVLPFRLERALGDAAFASRAGDVARAERAERSAKQALAEIRQALDSTDAAALKVHPWRVRLERGRVRGD